MKTRPTTIRILLVVLIVLVALFVRELILRNTPPLPRFPHSEEPYRVFGDPSEYGIVYLITQDAANNQNDVLSLIPEVTQARVAHRWQDVADFHVQKPIEALIVERSAYPLVDKTWTAAMSRQGLVIATINLYGEAQTEMRDSDCKRQKPPQSSPFEEDYFLVVSHLIQTEDPAELDQAIELSYTTCKTPKTVSRLYETSKGTHSPIRRLADVQYLTNTIIGHIDQIRSAKKSVNPLTGPTVPPEFLSPERTADPLQP